LKKLIKEEISRRLNKLKMDESNFAVMAANHNISCAGNTSN
jgi:hypothetical protein